MRKFLTEDFMLHSESARKLYHECAAGLPIMDYHCHLQPKEIVEDKKYRNIFELWLGGDHYKWRAMRTNGVKEELITGDAPEKEKFMKWAETVPYLIGNPLFHWTHLELRTYFDFHEMLTKDNAEHVWNLCNEKLQSPEFSARNLIKRSNVEMVGTTDAPADDLHFHAEIKKSGFSTKVLPTYRPDQVLNIEADNFKENVEKVGKAAGVSITSFASMKDAVKQRLEHFKANGCVESDHGLQSVCYVECTEQDAENALKKALHGEKLSEFDIEAYKTQLMLFMWRKYSEYGWVSQYHIGAIRNNNSRMFKQLGPDTGFDSIAHSYYADKLSKFMDTLAKDDQLPKTVLYCLNPSDNEVLGTMLGNFQGGGIQGKIQFGSGWWFNDTKDGMIRQMTALSSLGMLSRFVGMLTDSRSFISYPRHEYFRRIMCNLIGDMVEHGEYPSDYKLLGEIVQNISYYNIKKYLGI